jgi:ABC-type branched-subunit amino acid transport system substrate-binding protein
MSQSDDLSGVSRRTMLLGMAGATGAIMLPNWAMAEDQPPIGTWPAGSQGDTVNIGVAVPRTGTYAEQGEDELKGWELAVEHINAGHDLMKQFVPGLSTGLLGK